MTRRFAAPPPVPRSSTPLAGTQNRTSRSKVSAVPEWAAEHVDPATAAQRKVLALSRELRRLRHRILELEEQVLTLATATPSAAAGTVAGAGGGGFTTRPDRRAARVSMVLCGNEHGFVDEPCRDCQLLAGQVIEAADQELLGQVEGVYAHWKGYNNAITPVRQGGALLAFSGSFERLMLQLGIDVDA